MAIKNLVKKYSHNQLLYTIIAAFLLCAVFLMMVSYIYSSAENEAYENLHVQTKQIKDSITLQMISDRENLATMANFAAKLYADGEDYSLLFASFKPIGLVESIGILNADNTFITSSGGVELSGLISFDEEVQKGAYISGRMSDVVNPQFELIRSAVPIQYNDETVGILYGAITLEKVAQQYEQMSRELDAQLFVYDKATGDLVIDTVHQKLGNISFLKDRKYNDDYSYEQIITTDKGFSSFMSAYKDENMHLHYSTMEEIGWMIGMARYDSQVFAQARSLANVLAFTFFAMLVVIVIYILVLTYSERKANAVTKCASDVRKILLETEGGRDHITEALKEVCMFAKGRSAVFFNTDGEEYNYLTPQHGNSAFSAKDKQVLMTELFWYAGELYKERKTAVNVLQLKRNEQLKHANEAFYTLLKKLNIYEIAFSATVSSANQVVILAVINPQWGKLACVLAEKIAACFSMALYNMNRFHQTRLAATTDALTGALNRVAYKNDLKLLERGKMVDFSCIYIDVNELHLRNNLYGHAAGDEMLIYIANTLKEIFYGHRVYRMGGDEFLVFCQNTQQEAVKKGITQLKERLQERDYHVSIGMSYRTQNTNTDEMVQEAEIRMYEDKNNYYQRKQRTQVTLSTDKEYIQIKTGIPEVDKMFSVMTENYSGIYRVSLDTDKARRILMPKELNYNEDEDNFSKLFSKYVAAEIPSDYHRAVMSFLNYDILRRQLMEGETPKISYKKNSGENVVLSVYRLGDTEASALDTLWVFANE